MGNIDDRNTLGLQITDGAEQMLCFFAVQGRGRLIHDDHSGITGNCLDDLHHLHLCQRKLSHNGRCRIGEFKLIQDLLCLFVCLFLVQDNAIGILTV